MKKANDPKDLDEALSALLDGELDEASARSLRERLAAEPDLAERYAELAAADAAFGKAMAALDDKPLPAAVLALLEMSDTDAAGDNVIDLAERTARTRPGGHRAAPLPLALAAGIALVVGFFAAQVLGPRVDGGNAQRPLIAAGGSIPPASPLYAVLQQPSGVVVPLEDGGSAMSVLSFERENGGFCRELKVRAPDGTNRAVACREAGDWRVQVAEFAPPSAADRGYQVASDGDSVVADWVGRMMRGDPLDPAAEAARLESAKQ